MTLLGAFLVGYWMGTRAGEDGMNKLVEAGTKVLRSEEFQGALAGATMMARGALASALEPKRDDGRHLRAA